MRISHSKPTLGDAEVVAVSAVLRSGNIAQGGQVAAFEAECAEFAGRRFGVAVNSGTSALHLSLGALGVGRDAPVAIPSYACAALMTAVDLQGARSLLCDVGDDFNIVPDLVPDDCRSCIVPHLFGATAAIPNVPGVIEDIAQSIGGGTGRYGDIAVASFYATKLMTAGGEGGMVLTDDEGIADYARERRDYDNRDDFVRRYPYKMTDLEAAVGRIQLKKLPAFIRRRREIAQRYLEAFADMPLRVPEASCGHVFYRFVVTTEQRDALQAHLAGHGVDAKRPVYRPAHHYTGGEFPGAENAHRRALSLPIYPSLIDAEVVHVINSVRSFFESG